MLPEGISEGERAAVIERTLAKREGSAQHVAQAVLLLVENEFMTGTCLTVDGGRTIYAGDEAAGS
jgi:pteridine reductase